MVHPARVSDILPRRSTGSGVLHPAIRRGGTFILFMEILMSPYVGRGCSIKFLSNALVLIKVKGGNVCRKSTILSLI